MKIYVLRQVNSDDLVEIQELVRGSNCLVSTPSNITDIYDAERYRKENLFEEVNLKTILDNNIFTQILPLVDGRKKEGVALSGEQKLICGIMCFLIYSGIEIIPISAIYERSGHPDYLSKEKQDYLFRVADHIHPQIYADLALGKYSDIPKEHFLKIKKEVDTNPETQKDIKNTRYPSSVDNVYLLIYMNLLKAWLLYKEGITAEEKIKKYLSWHSSHSLADNVSTIFTTIFLSKKRFPKMFKNINSDNPEVIKKNIKNAAWDLYHLSFLESLHATSGADVIWFFCTRDKLLLKLSGFLYKLSSIDELKAFVSDFYKPNISSIFESHVAKINSRPNRLAHVKKVNTTLLSNIGGLEKEVTTVLLNKNF